MITSVPGESAPHVLLRDLPPVVAVRFERLKLYIELEDGREIGAPIAWFPTLQEATPDQRAKWRLFVGGDVIEWPDLDEHVSVHGLMGLSD